MAGEEQNTPGLLSPLGCCLRAHLALPLIIKPMNSCRLLGLIERAEFSPDSHICIINYLLERCEEGSGQRRLSGLQAPSRDHSSSDQGRRASATQHHSVNCCVSNYRCQLCQFHVLLSLRINLFTFFSYL